MCVSKAIVSCPFDPHLSTPTQLPHLDSRYGPFGLSLIRFRLRASFENDQTTFISNVVRLRRMWNLLSERAQGDLDRSVKAALLSMALGVNYLGLEGILFHDS